MATPILTAARLRELLDYDPATGIFTRRIANRMRPVGAVVGTKHKTLGYLVAEVDGKLHYLHRLAFLWMNGEMPSELVDHRDGDRSNNRWANLRNVTRLENQQNLRKARKDSYTGLLGASPLPGGGFIARIRVAGKYLSLGTFENPEEAHAAYVAAKRRLHPGNTL